MKVIEVGDVKRGKWWIGMVAVCGKCGRKVQLELTDDQHLYWMHVPDPNLVRIGCETCGGAMEVRRS